MGFCRHEHFYFSLLSVWGAPVALPGTSSPPRISHVGPGLSQQREDHSQPVRSSPAPALPCPHGQSGDAQMLTQGKVGSGQAEVGTQPGRAILASHLILLVPH